MTIGFWFDFALVVLAGAEGSFLFEEHSEVFDRSEENYDRRPDDANHEHGFNNANKE
jgi:hypothetical protein